MQYNNINKNTFYYTIKTVMGIIYPLITFPYISRVLLPTNVGKINFSASIVSYFALVASLGISTYAIRECSKVRDNKEKFENEASQIFSINLLSTIVAYFALALMLFFARRLDEYRKLICIQSATIIFTTIGADWVNTVIEDFKYIAIKTVGMQVIALILLVVFVQNPDDYVTYAIISVIASSGACIINLFYRRNFCKTKFTFRIDWKKHLPPILLLFSVGLMQTIYVNSDMTMLGLIKGDFEVGLYSTSVKIYTLVKQIVASINVVLMPQLSEAFEKNRFVRVNELLKYGLSFIITLGFPCIAGLNVIAIPIIGAIGGNEYLTANISLHILTLAFACSAINVWIAYMMMLPAGKDSVCLKAGTISALTNVVLNLLIIPRWGLNGAAFTTVIAEIVSIVFLMNNVDKRIRIKGIIGIIKAPFIGSILIVAIGLFTTKMLSSYVAITVTTIVTSVCAYTLVLYIFKNEFFMGYAKSIFEKIKSKF